MVTSKTPISLICAKAYGALYFLLVITGILLTLHWPETSLADTQISKSDPPPFNLTTEEKNWLAKHPDIKVGIMDDWPPFDFIDKYGTPSGIGVDYIKALNRRLGDTLTLVPGAWKDIYEDVKEKRLDAIMDITPKPEREGIFNFTTPYLDVPHVIVARTNTPFLRNEDALTNKTIALESGFGNVAYFKNNYPNVSIKEYKNTRLALGAVARGEVDAYAGNRSVALYIMGQEIITNLEVHGRLRKNGSILAIGTRKDWPTLVKILDRALADISQNEIRLIQDRWVGKDNTSKPINITDKERDWLNNHPSIRIAFDKDYPPYSFQNEKGEFAGIAVDIARELAEKIGLKLDIYPNGQWKQLYAASLQKEVDVIATLVNRPGREASFEFTRPYLSLSQYIITRNEDLKATTDKQSLLGKTIALVEGYSTTELLLEEISDIKPYFVSSLEEAIHAVSTGKAQATIGDIAMANHIITQSGLNNLGFPMLYTRSQAKQRFGIRKDWPELATIMDKALESISYRTLMAIYARGSVPEVVKPEAGFLSVIDELTEKEKAWLESHPVIRLASDSAWLPYEAIDGKGQFSGIAADYIKLIEKRLGIQFVRSPRKPWNEITEMLRNKDLDVFTCAMETQDRNTYAKFTRPYLSHPMAIITRDDVGYIDGLPGLHNKTIAVEQGYASWEILTTNHPELKIRPYTDSKSALLDVSKNEVFAYIGNIATMSHVARNLGITNIKISGQIPYQFELAMGVRNDWPELVPILQKALDAISLEEKNTILQKWIAVKVHEPTDYALIWQIIGLIIVILIGILYWNFILNRVVKKRTSQLLHQAHFDSLTDLPNRFLILDRLTQLISTTQRSKDQVAVLLLDLDDFKKINDTLDHQAGDQLLIETANRLKTTIRFGDSIGRLSGDEFIVLIGGLSNPSDVSAITENLMACFNEAFLLDGRELRLTVSIGIAIYPGDGEDASELLSNADSALHHSKQLGRNTYSYFTDAMNKAVSRRLLIEEHMHGALDRGEFETYYQPKVAIATQEIVGFEALLRWHNPELGEISPCEFIPIAEHNGLIISIGQFVMKHALETFASWQQQYGQLSSIAVNLSPRQFRDPDLVESIKTTVQESGIASHCLELEITEGVLLSEQAYIDDTLAAIKQFGVHIAMDDFGTGYSSLSYLRNYHFDIIKIDREFVDDIAVNQSDKELASATIAMAHNLGLKVIAEGVESDDQLAVLTAEGCDLAQGYLFSKPLPAIEITRILEKNI